MFLNLIDHKFVNDKIIFAKVIEEMKFLKNVGIKIQLQDKLITIKFMLVLISGDNLGLNSYLSFQENFASNRFCRSCYTYLKKINKVID